jgi:outer membrane protein assembly factor BamB
VYTIGASGELRALDLAKGAILWEKSFEKDFKGGKPEYGYCCSPIVIAGKLVVSPSGAAGMAALDLKTGNVAWKTPGGGCAYASLAGGNLGNVLQVLGYDGDAVAGWDAATGKKLWSVDPAQGGAFNVPSPIIASGKVFAVQEKDGARLYAIEAGGKAKAEPVATFEDLKPDSGSPICYQGLIFCSTPSFYCLDAADLKLCWQNDEEGGLQGYTCLIAGNDRVLVFGGGDLTLLAANKTKCEVLGKTKLCGSTFAYPALAGGKLFVRDGKFVYCYAMK